MTRNGIAYYKYKDFKKAVVTFTDALRDVGLGTRVPELEEQGNAMDVDYSDEDGERKQIGPS
jgi:hypothetical protein